jgi:hypothetical protein
MIISFVVSVCARQPTGSQLAEPPPVLVTDLVDRFKRRTINAARWLLRQHLVALERQQQETVA